MPSDKQALKNSCENLGYFVGTMFRQHQGGHDSFDYTCLCKRGLIHSHGFKYNKYIVPSKFFLHAQTSEFQIYVRNYLLDDSCIEV